MKCVVCSNEAIPYVRVLCTVSVQYRVQEYSTVRECEWLVIGRSLAHLLLSAHDICGELAIAGIRWREPLHTQPVGANRGDRELLRLAGHICEAGRDGSHGSEQDGTGRDGAGRGVGLDARTNTVYMYENGVRARDVTHCEWLVKLTLFTSLLSHLHTFHGHMCRTGTPLLTAAAAHFRESHSVLARISATHALDVQCESRIRTTGWYFAAVDFEFLPFECELSDVSISMGLIYCIIQTITTYSYFTKSNLLLYCTKRLSFSEFLW